MIHGQCPHHDSRQKKQQKYWRKENSRIRKTKSTHQLFTQQIKSEISSDGMHVFSIFLYSIYLFTFVFKICLFILVPVMCNLFPKRGILFFKLNRGKLHDNKQKI